jgi:hypothetical protein
MDARRLLDFDHLALVFPAEFSNNALAVHDWRRWNLVRGIQWINRRKPALLIHGDTFLQAQVAHTSRLEPFLEFNIPMTVGGRHDEELAHHIQE